LPRIIQRFLVHFLPFNQGSIVECIIATEDAGRSIESGENSELFEISFVDLPFMIGVEGCGNTFPSTMGEFALKFLGSALQEERVTNINSIDIGK
jgi:hypothetical protein